MPTKLLFLYFPLTMSFDILCLSSLSLALASAKQGIVGHSLCPSSKLMRNSARLGFLQTVELQRILPEPFCCNQIKTGALQHLVKGKVSQSEKNIQQLLFCMFWQAMTLKIQKFTSLKRLLIIWYSKTVRVSSALSSTQLFGSETTNIKSNTFFQDVPESGCI